MSMVIGFRGYSVLRVMMVRDYNVFGWLCVQYYIVLTSDCVRGHRH
jgi:hypothetical protein